MSFKKTDAKITRYEHGNFYIDVVGEEYGVSAWLHHRDYGISEMMFGLPRKQEFTGEEFTDDELIEIIKANLNEYEVSYLKGYGD